MSAMFSDKIRIRLKAYDSRVLDQSTTEIVDTAKRTGARLAEKPPDASRCCMTVQPAVAAISMGTPATKRRSPINVRSARMTSPKRISLIWGFLPPSPLISAIKGFAARHAGRPSPSIMDVVA